MLSDKAIGRALVFTRTKHGANKLVRQLVESRIGADAIHGDKTQGARQRALADFRSGRTRVLVATDIAARGIDIDGITHVINFEIPNMPESYVHRIGRTARAGATGIALSFCGPEERSYLRDIERLTRRTLTVVADHPFVSAAASAPAKGTGVPREGEREGGYRNGKGQRSFRGRSQGGRSSGGRPSGGRPNGGRSSQRAA
jgi:ATP-dependent RNA helicase RhlE